MNEPVDGLDLELQELHEAVNEAHALLGESWFHELAVCEVGEHLDKLADLLEQAGLTA